jgi:hypothetical protein
VVAEVVDVDEALRAFAKVSAKRKPKVTASPTLPISGGLSYSWQGVRVGGPVLTVRLETGPFSGRNCLSPTGQSALQQAVSGKQSAL